MYSLSKLFPAETNNYLHTLNDVFSEHFLREGRMQC